MLFRGLSSDIKYRSLFHNSAIISVLVCEKSKVDGQANIVSFFLFIVNSRDAL